MARWGIVELLTDDQLELNVIQLKIMAQAQHNLIEQYIRNHSELWDQQLPSGRRSGGFAVTPELQKLDTELLRLDRRYSRVVKELGIRKRSIPPDPPEGKYWWEVECKNVEVKLKIEPQQLELALELI